MLAAFFGLELPPLRGWEYFSSGNKQLASLKQLFPPEKHSHPQIGSFRLWLRLLLSSFGFLLGDWHFQSDLVAVQQHRVGFDGHGFIFQALAGDQAEVLFV